MRRIPWFGLASLLLLGIGALHRFAYGLGAATNLSDAFPWGLWVGFDVLIGVATTAGGFAFAFTVYILRKHEYHSLARGAVLTAFLGYVFVGAALFFDLGHPMRLWHPMIFWNPHSVMFEVAWCVMIYTTVLAAEFAPEVLGALGHERWGRMIHRAMPVLAGLGVLLSILHQSSLGTLYLIVPLKLHAYWYTPVLPAFFFLTAIQCGLGMVILEGSLSHAILHMGYEEKQLRHVGRALFWMTGLNLVLRLLDLRWRGVAWESATYESVAFLCELGIGWILPLALLARKARLSPPRLFLAAMLTVGGIMLNRLNIAVTGMERAAGLLYLPSLTEVAITVGIAGVGISVFGMMARFVDLAPREPGPATHLVTPGTAGVLVGVFGLLLLIFTGARTTDVLAWGHPAPFVSGDSTVIGIPVYTRVMTISETSAVNFQHTDHPGDCASCHDSALPVLDRDAMDYSHETGFCRRCHDGRRAFAMDTACVSCHKTGRMKPYVYPLGPGSPGRVRFEHARHTAALRGECRTCHQAAGERAWPELATGCRGSQAAALTMEPIYQGKACGSCHDGRHAFGGDACERCHHQGR